MTLPLVINPGDSGHIGDHEEMHALLANATSPFDNVALDGAGTLAARPAAGVQGRYYLATDESVLYRDTGSAWNPISSYLTDFILDILATAPTAAGLKLPSARVGKTVSQSIPTGSGAQHVVTFDAESGSFLWDNDGLHSVSSNTGRLVATREGYWIAGATINWAANATGDRFVRLRQSNGNNLFARNDRTASATTETMDVTGMCFLSVGDYVEVVLAQTSGSPLNIQTGCSFWMAFHGDR